MVDGYAVVRVLVMSPLLAEGQLLKDRSDFFNIESLYHTGLLKLLRLSARIFLSNQMLDDPIERQVVM